MKRSPTILLALLATVVALFAAASPASAEPALPEGFQDEVVFDGISQPTTFRFAPDGRVFVAQKTGKIVVFSNLVDKTPEDFADLRTFVYDNGDRGLLGMVLDPNFPVDPYVYALYTYDHILGDSALPPKWGTAGTSGDPCPEKNGGDACLVSGRLVRLTAEGNKAKGPIGDPEQKVLAEGWCQQFSSHSVGDLEFGPEGALYVGGGDGASFSNADYGQFGTVTPNPCGDPPGGVGVKLTTPTAEGGALRSQNMTLLNGKVLRINPDTGKGLPDNPLASSPNENTQRIIASGFRNPFRFALDPQTGEIYSDNVGSSEIEEIDRFDATPSAVYNSGWPCYEGLARQFQYRELGLNVCNALYAGEPQSTSLPLFSYSHGQSVVPNDECPLDYGSALGGISFYEGDEFPDAYKGALFFSDAVRACTWVMFPGDDGRPDPTTTIRFMRDGLFYPAVDIAEGPDGLLYYANLSGTDGDGSINRISYKPGAPKARLEATPPYGVNFPLEVTFDASTSTDPGGGQLTYDWDLDEDGEFEIENSVDPTEELDFTQAEHDERKTKGLPLNRVVTVRVEDADELTSVATVTVYPGDKPPVAVIDQPATTLKWAVGDNIHLRGSAIKYDVKPAGESVTTPLNYYWSNAISHCPTDPDHCHAHPLQIFSGMRDADFSAPEHDYPSYIEITVRVADGRGLTGSKTIQIHPKTVNLALSTSPPGIELTAGLLQGAAPFALTAIQGSNVQLSAPQSAVLNGDTYVFQGWSDGGERSHSVLAGSDASYLATYSGGPGKEPPPPPPEPDAKPPATKLGSHPPKSTKKTTAKFKFSSNESGSSFKCKLDRKSFKACRSPQTYKKLKPGKHTFKVVATDAAGNADPSAASFSWKVLPPKG